MPKQENPNVRFWEYVRNGWVKLTLRPNQSLSWGESHRDDEGYSFQQCEWTYEDKIVRREWCNGGRDCDGPISTRGCEIANVDELNTVAAYLSPRPEVEGSSPASRLHMERHWEKERAKHECVLGSIVTGILRPNWQKGGPTEVNDAYARAAGY